MGNGVKLSTSLLHTFNGRTLTQQPTYTQKNRNEMRFANTLSSDCVEK